MFIGLSTAYILHLLQPCTRKFQKMFLLLLRMQLSFSATPYSFMFAIRIVWVTTSSPSIWNSSIWIKFIRVFKNHNKYPLQSHSLIKPCQTHSVNGQKNFMTVLCWDKELPHNEYENRSGAIAPIITNSADLIHYKEKGEFFSYEFRSFPSDKSNIKYH